MFIDAQNLFCDSQNFDTVGAEVSTNVIDLGVDRDIGVGEPMGVVLTVEVAADFTTTDETYQIDVQTDDNYSFSSASVIARRIPLAAELTKGTVMVIPLPNTNERYLRLSVTGGGTSPSVTLTAHLAPLSMVQNNRTYADGFSIMA